MISRKDTLHHLRADDARSLEHLPSKIQEEIIQKGMIPIALLGSLAKPDHYSGPEEFEEVVDLGDSLEHLRGAEVAEEKRWGVGENIPSSVTVLSIQKPEIVDHLHAVTQIANSIPWPTKEYQKERADYASHIRAVIRACTEHFQRRKTKNTRVLIMLRGAEFLAPDFPVEEDKYISVEVKRLDLIEQPGSERAHRTMKFGMTGWRGLENFAGWEPIDLVVPDDCISTAGSLRAGITGILQKSKEGAIPPIKSITVYAAVGVQFGIEELVKFGEEIGIPLEVVVGHVAYAYTPEFYLRRMKGEKGLNGKEYQGTEQIVSDMGAWLSPAS